MEPISSPQATGDPFLQSAIEHWLDTTNELTYQPLFCQWLSANGYTLKYSIKNTHFEQGKDVVATTSDGTPVAFQLKGGNINLNRWRREVKPEIDILIGGAIQHPEIDKGKPHLSYLVTNGEIEDNVRSEILALNERSWRDAPLHYWTRGDLLSGFQQMARGILPKDAEDYKNLIDLMFANGTGFPDQARVFEFLQDILNLREATRKLAQRRRDISAAVLYGTMIAGPYRAAKNHASVVRIMVMLASLVLYVAERFELDDKYWLESFKIVWGDAYSTASLLEQEIKTDGFGASVTGPLEADLMPFRKHNAASIIIAYKLAQLIDGTDEWSLLFDGNFDLRYSQSITIWGEASFLPLLMLALLFSRIPERRDQGLKYLRSMVGTILSTNGRNSQHEVGLIPPYHDVDDGVKQFVEMVSDEEKCSYVLSSYYLKSLVETLVRLDQRDFLSEHWRELSFMHFEEFIPPSPSDLLLWRVEEGENRTTIPKKETSWADLKAEAGSRTGEALPSTLKRFPAFIPFFLATMPFRVTPDIVGYLSSVMTR